MSGLLNWVCNGIPTRTSHLFIRNDYFLLFSSSEVYNASLVLCFTHPLFVHCFALKYLACCFFKGTSGFHKTFRVWHVYYNFKIGFTCRITIVFGTLKDESLLINILASNICFSFRNMFQNGVDALSKIVDAFLPKSLNFYLVRIIR